MRRLLTIILVMTIASPCAFGQPEARFDGQDGLASPSSLFKRLGDANDTVAFAAMRRLELIGPRSVPFLSERLSPVEAPDADHVRQLIAELASDSYQARTRAYRALLDLGPAGQSAMMKALTDRPSLAERRRLGVLLRLARCTGPQTVSQRRRLRALRALERIGTPAALTTLERLASGHDKARMTIWADTAARRMAGRLRGESRGAMAGGDIGRSGCFDGNAVRKPGKLAWRLNIGEYRYPATSIVVHDGVAYMGVDHADVGPMICTLIYAVDLKSRRVLWTQGHAEQTVLDAPAVHEGTVYYCSASDGSLHAIDAKTGRPRWRVRSDRAAVASPVVDGPTAYFGSNDGHFRAVDTQFGRVLWSADLGQAVNMPAALGNRHAVVPAGRRMYSLDRKTGRTAWTHDAELMVGAPAVREGLACFTRFDQQDGGGSITGVDLATGETRWSIPVRNASPFAPAMGDGVVYAIGSDRRELLAVDAAKGTIRWRVKLSCEVWQSPVTAGTMVYLIGREEGNVLAVDTRRHRLRWTFDTHSRRAVGSPAVVDGTLYVASRHWKLCAITERSDADDDARTVAQADAHSGDRD